MHSLCNQLNMHVLKRYMLLSDLCISKFWQEKTGGNERLMHIYDKGNMRPHFKYFLFLLQLLLVWVTHTHSWVMLPWIKQKAPEVGILLHFLKIDQRVKDAPHFLFLIKIQDEAAERLRCNHKAFICKSIIKLIYLNTNACSRCLSLLLKEYSTVLCDFLLGHF